MKRMSLTLGVPKQRIMLSVEYIAACRKFICVPPHDLITEILATEKLIQYELSVMCYMPVEVNVYAACLVQ